MVEIPSRAACLDLLQGVGCSAEVIAHCCAVADVAVCIARRVDADVRLVEAGALLHDIGRSQIHGIQHAVVGARIAKKLGMPEGICRIIERHIGAGIPKGEAAALGLPVKGYMPETLEEKIVAHADNLIENNHIQPIEGEIRKAKQRGLTAYAKRLQLLHEELSRLCGIDCNDIFKGEGYPKE